MKSEIITLIDYLEKEHGLDKGTIATILEKSIEAVAKKKDDLPPITVSIDTEDGSINTRDMSSFSLSRGARVSIMRFW